MGVGEQGPFRSEVEIKFGEHWEGNCRDQRLGIQGVVTAGVYRDVPGRLWELRAEATCVSLPSWLMAVAP